MVIEKVHGLHATSVSLNDRFTMLAAMVPNHVAMRPKKRQTVGNFLNQTLNIRNRNLIEQIARTLEQQAKRQALRQRLGLGPGALRRFGSENSLPGLRHSNSFNSIGQTRNIKTRSDWWQSNGNLSRSQSMSSVWAAARQLRGYRRRAGVQRALQGRFRGGRQNQVRITHVQQRMRRGGQIAAGGAGRGRGRGRGAGRGTGRGNGRGSISRNQTPKPVPTREELDLQLDQYMAGSKSALDRELETYMKNAMDLE